MADFDSPWKEALEVFFRHFLALFFPQIEADIDWSRGFVFLDKELQKILPKAENGRLYVDKLVKVWLKNGDEEWVLIHIEVQAQRNKDFPRRMFGYNTRIFDVYNRTVVSLAVLADDEPGWRPDRYEAKRWGWSVRMDWPAVKLLDYSAREAELQQSTNPFARIVLAHLKTLETRQDFDARRVLKLKLIRELYNQGFSNHDVWNLFHLIDWLMDLPKPEQERFNQEVNEFQKGTAMPFYDAMQLIVMQRVLEDLLRAKFGDEGGELMPAITSLWDAEAYFALTRAIGVATTIDQVRKTVAEAKAAHDLALQTS